MKNGARDAAAMPSGMCAAVHVATLEDALTRLAATASAEAMCLWDQPVKLAAALRVLHKAEDLGCLGASLILDGGNAGAMAAAWDAGIRLICWSPAPGLWNHIRFAGPSAAADALTAFAAGSPDIVHSWQAGGAADEFTMPPFGHPLLAAYGDVTPLAGLPLWRHLGTPARLLQALCSSAKDRVLRRRVDPETGAEWEIGSDMGWHFLEPAALADGVLDEICRMVAAGGSVNTRWVRHNLERAFLIAYVTERGRIVGNSSLKHPREEYIAAVRSRYDLDFSQHLERGYTSVRPEYRGLGIGTRLLEGLTRRAGKRKIFSIIAEDNIATQKIAIRNRTRKVATVFSEAMGKEIGFWVPEEGE